MQATPTNAALTTVTVTRARIFSTKIPFPNKLPPSVQNAGASHMGAGLREQVMVQTGVHLSFEWMECK